MRYIISFNTIITCLQLRFSPSFCRLGNRDLEGLTWLMRKRAMIWTQREVGKMSKCKKLNRKKLCKDGSKEVGKTSVFLTTIKKERKQSSCVRYLLVYLRIIAWILLFCLPFDTVTLIHILTSNIQEKIYKYFHSSFM